MSCKLHKHFKPQRAVFETAVRSCVAGIRSLYVGRVQWQLSMPINFCLISKHEYQNIDEINWSTVIG